MSSCSIRSPRRVHLTPEGERFLPEARAPLAAAARARASVGPGETTIVLGTSEGLGDHLTRVLAALRELMPQLTVELAYARTQARLDGVRDGSLTATFVRGLAGSTGLRLIPVWEDPILAALPAAHEVAGPSVVELSELAPLRLRLSDRATNPPLFDQLVSACRDTGFAPDFGPVSNGLQNTLALIGADGTSWTPVYESHARMLRSPNIAFRHLRPALAITTYLAVRPGERPPWLNPLIQASRDHDS
ncbi:MAG TPA: LysR family substrate-binding domain-containing protein [Pseudonocardia sp.]|nr:LysR family substrate-binding domain-containing protein [Pseudonocardia sp.]